MQTSRAGGILLHPSSLPGAFGIGDLGPQAHKFVDWLAASGCALWQVLPLGPTGYGNSPYQCHSVFAGNVYMISPEFLARDELVTEEDLLPVLDRGPESGRVARRVDFSQAIPAKLLLLNKAYERFSRRGSPAQKVAFAEFRAENAGWLDDYALFMALKEQFGGASWTRWPALLRERNRTALARVATLLAEATTRHAFSQMLFFKQWAELREHAKRRGVSIIGDVPIFAAEDSAELWAKPELFCMDASLLPSVVAGVPPDYFGPTGQLWGNPLYSWPAHKESGYAWWLERLQATMRLVDAIRLDHFRGFAAYWEIPASSRTAEKGRWMPGPAHDFLDNVVQRFQSASGLGRAAIIAEDLGVLSPDVLRLLDRYGLPGMRVLLFGFAGLHEDFLPHNYVPNCVAYTGTHDNDTALGWFLSASASERRFALRYLHSTDRGIVRDMIRAVWSSVAMFAIVPMQDLLELGNEARMNHPGRPEGNWEWRLATADLSDVLLGRLRDLNAEFRRGAREAPTELV